MLMIVETDVIISEDVKAKALTALQRTASEETGVDMSSINIGIADVPVDGSYREEPSSSHISGVGIFSIAIGFLVFVFAVVWAVRRCETYRNRKGVPKAVKGVREASSEEAEPQSSTRSSRRTSVVGSLGLHHNSPRRNLLRKTNSTMDEISAQHREEHEAKVKREEERTKTRRRSSATPRRDLTDPVEVALCIPGQGDEAF